MSERKPPLEYESPKKKIPGPVATGITAGCLIGMILAFVALMIVAELRLLPHSGDENGIEIVLIGFAIAMWGGGVIGGFIGYNRRRE